MKIQYLIFFLKEPLHAQRHSSLAWIWQNVQAPLQFAVGERKQNSQLYN